MKRKVTRRLPMKLVSSPPPSPVASISDRVLENKRLLEELSNQQTDYVAALEASIDRLRKLLRASEERITALERHVG